MKLAMLAALVFVSLNKPGFYKSPKSTWYCFCTSRATNIKNAVGKTYVLYTDIKEVSNEDYEKIS